MSKELKIKMTNNGVVSVDLSGNNDTRLVEDIINELKKSSKPSSEK